MLQQLDLFHRFDAEIAVPNVNKQDELAHILQESGAFAGPEQVHTALDEIAATTGSADIGVGIKKILTGIETAKQDPQDMAGRFASVMAQAIAARGFA